MNEYLIKNYLRTVISYLASPATFLYLQWNIVCDEIPDLDYALELIHSLEQALVLFYQFLASCGVITQKDSNLAKFELEQALELIHSECLEEVAADQIMQAFPMDDETSQAEINKCQSLPSAGLAFFKVVLLTSSRFGHRHPS